MAITRLLINSLSGGVGRQAPTKRLVTEAENIDNCLVTLEKSVEKRPPLTRIKESNQSTSYLDLSNINPGETYNQDHLYFHFLDIDGYNRYCIIINRAGYPFDPTSTNSFTNNGNNIKLTDFLTVYRIEPTEWVKEQVDDTFGTSGSNTSGFNRGIFEYLTFGNKEATTQYRIANSTVSIPKTSIKDTFGSTDFDVGILLWNKLVNIDYLPDNSTQDNGAGANDWYTSLLTSTRIHSGDVINYKVSTKPANAAPSTEDIITQNNQPNVDYWRNVRDDIQFYIEPDSLEETEVGQNLENFGEIPQYPASEVYNDVRDLNGYKAVRMLFDYYDKPRLVPIPQSNTIDWSTDHYQLTSPLAAESRDGNTDYLGFGKIYFARNPYLTFPAGFYRATRYNTNPYFERVRAEGPNSVLDHRRFPVVIYKDTKTDGKWRIKHMPLFPRRSGTSLSNPGPKAVERKERIQSATVWKSRLWIATDNTILASRTNSFYDFWVNDINNITETDPIDIQSSVGNYNQFSYIVPFQNILFALSSGSVQFEVRGGSGDVGISPFNVELRPTSFFSTSKLNYPQKMGNNVFFTNAGKMFMYLSGSTASDEFSTSMDISNHIRGYLPENLGAITSSSATNSIFMVDQAIPYHVYVFTFRTNGEKIIQNAFHRWIFSNQDSVVSFKSYEKDLYVLSKRTVNNSKKLVVYFMSLESVPNTTVMLDWLYKVPVNDITTNGNNLVITLPHQDTATNYVVLANEWGTSAYTAIAVPTGGNTTVNGVTVLTIPRPTTNNNTNYPVWVGRSYQMNVELSPQVKRGNDGVSEQVLEGVMNLKRITTRHLNSGSYDIAIKRNNRAESKVTFFPTDVNSIMTTNNQLKIDLVGEQYSKVLSYSEGTQIFIRSSYPTPCNISNIEILGTWRARNTSIE